MISKAGVHIKVKEIKSSLNFYSLFLDKAIFAYGSPEFHNFLKTKGYDCQMVSEKYNGVTYDIGGMLLEIADGHLAVKQDVFTSPMTSSKLSFMLHVPSVEILQQTLSKAGYSCAVPIRKFPWGTTEIVYKDPDGVVLVFIEKG